jgi:hypothetical protein
MHTAGSLRVHAKACAGGVAWLAKGPTLCVATRLANTRFGMNASLKSIANTPCDNKKMSGVAKLHKRCI